MGTKKISTKENIVNITGNGIYFWKRVLSIDKNFTAYALKSMNCSEEANRTFKAHI